MGVVVLFCSLLLSISVAPTVLAQTGSISGTVIEEGTGTPIVNCSVEAYDASTGYWITNDYTDESGDYTLEGLDTGDYKVSFNPYDGVHLGEWYDNKSDMESADLVSVVDPEPTTGIDAELAAGGSISGAVTEEGTGTPLENCWVYAYDAVTGDQKASGYTDASGNYTVSPLATGDYKVQFHPSDGVHLIEWYNNKPDQESADPVAVTAPNDTPDINAELTVGGSISGTVTEEGTGTPIQDCYVEAYNATTGNWMGNDHTDESGNYNLGALATGEYKVCFSPNDGIHIREWYDDKPDQQSADPVAVTAPNETPGIDAELIVGGSISGRVSEKGTGTPLDDCRVYVYEAATGNYVTSESTDSSGNYNLGALATGEYKVHFDPQDEIHIDEWYDNKSDQQGADIVYVTAPNETSYIDAALDIGGGISGTVTEEGTGTPLENCWVYAYEASTGNWAGSEHTDSSGNYAIGALATGNYKVSFSPDDGMHIREWYDDRQDQENADPVLVTAPDETSGIDAELAVGGSISGTVTEEGTGTPIVGCYVEAYDASTGSWMGNASTDESGTYTLGAIPTGEYKVQFNIYDGIHVREWYDNKTNQESADPVTVTAPNDTPGIDAELAVGGSISGTVTEEGTGNPIQNCYVTAYDATTGDYVTSDNPDASGNYTVGGLPTGDYKVEFYVWDGIHVREWYNDKPNRDSADPVTVTAPNDTPGIDAELAVGGSISGTVTEEGTGNPIQNCSISAYDATTGDYVVGDNPDESGNYTLGALPTGDYKVQFSVYDGIHVREWYDNKPDQESADPISVTAPNDTPGINAELSVGASISGRVVEEGTLDPIADCRVDVYDATARYWITSDNTDFLGNYTLGGLVTGDYVVSFDPQDGIHVPEYFDSKPDWFSADPVSVTAPNETSGINAALEEGGKISGTVTDEGTGDPIGDCRVEVLPLSLGLLPGQDVLDSDNTDASGNYTLGPLASGDYLVRFSSEDGVHTPEYFNDKPIKVVADPVTVTAPEETSGIDAALAIGGSISGTVTEEGTGNPLGDIQIAILHPEALEPMMVGETDASGNYTLGGLPTGDYKVFFFPQNEIHLPEWYDNKSNWISADLVSVTAPNDTPDINAELVISIEPTIALCFFPAAAQGQTVDVYLFGLTTHFQDGVSQATFSGDGITVNATIVLEPTLAIANITVDPNAAPGLRDVNVITGDETPQPLVEWFLVRDPQIFSVDPASAHQGETLDVEIVGADTYFQNGISQATLSGYGITVNSTTVVGTTHAVANITINDDAPLGIRDVTVTTSDEVAVGEDLFEVAGPLRIVSITPDSGYQGDTLDVTIIGEQTHFTQGLTDISFRGEMAPNHVSAISMTGGIGVRDINVVSETEVQATIWIYPLAIPGLRDVIVTTGSPVDMQEPEVAIGLDLFEVLSGALSR